MRPEEAKELMKKPGFLTPRQYRSVLRDANGDVSDYPDVLVVRIDGTDYSIHSCQRIVDKSKYYEDGRAVKAGAYTKK